MTEHGIEPPAHLHVKVAKNTDDTVHITLPANPQEDDLSDDDLSGAAGGSAGGQLASGAPRRLRGIVEALS